MSFEDIPEDREESFPCSHCGAGNITKRDGIWVCDTCLFTHHLNDEESKRDG